VRHGKNHALPTQHSKPERVKKAERPFFRYRRHLHTNTGIAPKARALPDNQAEILKTGCYVDTLIVGAIIEARSCERFAKLAPHLDDDLQKFYLSLLKSEARHYQDYLALASRAAEGEDISARVNVFLELEKSLIESPDVEFRFHSGIPAVA